MKERITSLFRKLPIAKKFTISVVLLIIVIMVAVNTLIITYQKNALMDEMENSQLLIIRNFAKDNAEPLMFLDPLKLDEHIQVVSQTPGCVYAMMTDRSGRVVAHTDRKQLGTMLAQYAFDHSSADQSPKSQGYSMQPETSIKEIILPVEIGYEKIGTVVAGFSRERMESLISESLTGLEHYVALISCIMLITGIGGAVLLSRVLTTPMRHLKQKMERVRSGALDIVIEDAGPDCRDVLKCDRSDCPAFGKKRCWTIIGTKCYGLTQSSVKDKIDLCHGCEVYRKTGGDEIKELIEAFNDMVIRLRDSLSELEQSNREKARLEKLSALGEMSMTVAHEVKNPLNAIRGAVSYLKDNFEGDVLREFLSIIEQETKRLNDIVTEYLVFSKPAPIKVSHADLNSAISDMVSLIRQEAIENNVEIITELDTSLKPFDFDIQQIKQALLNILVNAIDATLPGDAIKITTVSRNSSVDVIIKDNGQGIEKDILPEIFKPFYTTKTRGSGLGLACVERIIRDHKGNVTVRSEEGKGTEFIFSIPLEHGSCQLL
ncbi:MAG TPA: ATP-binding protein [Dissulfurispiraceae bacterium]|nr:ATP-binding protein [Dissulfurispiraceae bacterium]